MIYSKRKQSWRLYLGLESEHKYLSGYVCTIFYSMSFFRPRVREKELEKLWRVSKTGFQHALLYQLCIAMTHCMKTQNLGYIQYNASIFKV